MIVSKSAFLCLVLLAAGSLSCTIAPAQTALDAAREFNQKGIKAQTEGRLAEAAEQYRKALQINPNGAGYHNNLALVLKDLDQLPAAEQEARLALKLRPKRADYHFNLGLILQRESKPDLAEAEFREAIGLDALDPEFKFRLAQVLMQATRYVDAEAELKQALLLKPNEASYHQLLGDVLLKEGQHEEEALYEYRKVAELNPDGAVPGDVKNKIDYLKQVLKTR